MKKTALVIIIIFLLMNIASTGHCQDAFRKLGRGVVNMAACPFEFTKALGESYESGGVYEAVTIGLLKGLVMMTVRAGLGCVEAVTFPIPIPDNYKPILQPEFAWQK